MDYYRHFKLSAFEWLQKNVNEAYTGNAVYQRSKKFLVPVGWGNIGNVISCYMPLWHCQQPYL